MHSLVPLFDQLLVSLSAPNAALVTTAQQAMVKIDQAKDFASVVAEVRLARVQQELARICAGQETAEESAQRLSRDLVGARRSLAAEPSTEPWAHYPVEAAAYLRRLGAFDVTPPGQHPYFRPEAYGTKYPLSKGFQELVMAVRQRTDTPLPERELADLVRYELITFASVLDPLENRILQNYCFSGRRMSLQSLADEVGLHRNSVWDIERRLKIKIFRQIIRNQFLPDDPRHILIAYLDLSETFLRHLKRGHFYFLADLTEVTEQELSARSGLGKSSVAEIHAVLKGFDLDFKEEARSEWPPDLDPAILDESIDILLLSSRPSIGLMRMGIESIRQLVRSHESALLKKRNFNTKSVDEIKARLKARGLSLGMDV